MKIRKYILIVLAFLTSLLCAVGASLWVVLTDKVVLPQEFEQTTPTYTEPTINPIFYGEQATLTSTDTNGTWSIGDTTKLTASSATTANDTQGIGKTIQTTTKVKLTFKPNSIAYSTVTIEATVPMYAVANNSSTYYSRLDDALSNTTSGTVYAIPFGYAIETGRAVNAKTITKNTTFEATLCLPYSGTTYSNRENSASAPAFADTAESTYLKNLVTLADDVEFTNKGTLIIGGVLGTTTESGNQGHTSGDYAQINMGASSHIANSGTIECYGFIKDNNDSTIDNTGTIKSPFVVYDYRGPSHTVGAYKAENAGISPFNIFDLPNIYSEITTYSSSTINAFLDLYTQHDTLGAQHNLSEISIFASSNAVMNLVSGASVIMDFSTSESPTTEIGKTDLHFLGGANSGSLSIPVKFESMIDETVSMDSVLFPISWKLNIVFDKGTYNINNQYKLMPGSKVTITESATAEVTNNVILYTKDFKYQYPQQTRDASLIVEGTLNISDGSFGGYITPSKNATLNIANGVGLSLKSKEGAGLMKFIILEGLITYTFTENTASPTKSLQLPIYHGSNGSSTTKAGHTGTTYKAINGAWCPESVSFSYNSMGGSTIENTSGLSVYPNGYTIPDSVNNDDNIPTLENHSFEGWYLDSACTQNAVGATVWDYTTLYAKWQKDADKILVSFKLIGSDSNDITAMNNEAFKTQEMSDTVTKASKPNVDSLYQFNLNYERYIVGYYTDETGTTAFDFENTTITESIDIYVKWADKHKLNITLKQGTDSKIESGDKPTATITNIADNSKTEKLSLPEDGSTTYTHTRYLANGQTYKVSATDYKSVSGITLDTTLTAEKNVSATITGKDGSSCITPDTLVTLADGTQKEIQNITYQDLILVWDFYKGEYIAMPSSIIMNHGYAKYTVVALTFDDGTVIKTINGHGFFDKDQNEFVVIDENNVANYVGHNFVKQNVNETVKLISFTITEEYTESWSILTAEHYNCILEGMLTITPAEVEDSPKYLMPFEIGEDMKYDEQKMQADIEKYGLYTYEDFKDYMTYEQFKALNLSIFKVSVGKGYITWEEILYLISIHIK